MATPAVNELQLAPLGAGDLIDRTIRLYRRHFMALIRASVPPVVISATGAVALTVANREINFVEGGGRFVAYLGLWLFGFALWLVGFLLHWIVMGGASRNLVMHLLNDEPVSARAIYRNVRARFFALLGGTLLVGLWALVAGTIALIAWLVVFWAASLVLVLVSMSGFPVWLSAIAALLIFTASTVGALLFFFLLVGRVAYVPQVMLVEGRGVFDSVGRSLSLARRNVRRLTAMFLFTSFATWSALMLLLIPLGWFGYLNGVELLTLDASEWPVWYAIGYEVVSQSATILLTPVWMLGLSLLYVDERVRHEGYDVELLAARVFGTKPASLATHSPYASPVAEAPQPARSHAESFSGSVLGLTDRR